MTKKTVKKAVKKRVGIKVSDQLVLDLAGSPQLGFVEGEANIAARTAIRTQKKLCVIGEARSGKTQIMHAMGAFIIVDVASIDAYLAKGEAQNCVIDDSDQFAKHAQTALFHLYNFQQSHDVALTLFAENPISKWGVELPDLKSRLETFSQVQIEPPDDMMIAQILAKQFHARGVIVTHDLVDYAARRVKRSYADIEQAVLMIDRLAGQKHKVTKKLAKQYFEMLDE